MSVACLHTAASHGRNTLCQLFTSANEIKYVNYPLCAVIICISWIIAVNDEMIAFCHSWHYAFLQPFTFITLQYQPRVWLERTSLKWPTLCWVVWLLAELVDQWPMPDVVMTVCICSTIRLHASCLIIRYWVLYTRCYILLIQFHKYFGIILPQTLVSIL